MGRRQRQRHKGQNRRDDNATRPARNRTPAATRAGAGTPTFDDLRQVMADAGDRWRRNRADIKVARRIVTKWTLIMVVTLNAPLCAYLLVTAVIPEDERERYALIAVCAAVMTAVLSVSVAMYRAALSFVAGDPAAAGFEGHPHKFMLRELRDEILSAADFTGRWTVACLLWAVAYWGAVEVLSDGPISLPALKRDYIDVALLAGPLIGVIWWMGDSAIREGSEYHQRQLERSRTPLARSLLSKVYNRVAYKSVAFATRLAIALWLAEKVVG